MASEKRFERYLAVKSATWVSSLTSAVAQVIVYAAKTNSESAHGQTQDLKEKRKKETMKTTTNNGNPTNEKEGKNQEREMDGWKEGKKERKKERKKEGERWRVAR